MSFTPCSSVLAGLCFAFMVSVGHVHAGTYYVACDTGDDANDGVSELHAWQSADKVSAFDFQNGDSVRFKKGCTWENVSIKVSRSLTFEAYGDAATPPHLIAATRIRSWSKPYATGLVFTKASVASGSPSPKDILIVRDEKHGRFYESVRELDSLDSAGRFFHDVASGVLYVTPLAGVDPSRDLYVSNKPHILEFQPINIERVVVDGLHLSFANEYAIGFWYQLSGTKNGALRIANCLFVGNGYQAVHIGGTNTFRDVDIVNNTITANGHEGIYIGYVKGKEEGEVVTGTLRVTGNTIGGQGFGWRSQGPGSAANGEGIDIKKGVASAIIDHNTIADLTGFYGIGVQSSNVIIEQNTIRDIHMRDAPPDSGIAAIMVDAYDNKGPTIVRFNTIDVADANGIVIRGHAERRPRFEIHDNVVGVEDPYYQFAFTSQNVTNTIIRNNRTTGGRAGLWIQRPCCVPADVDVYDNNIRQVSMPLESVQGRSAGLHVHRNVFCLKGGNGAGQQRDILDNNTFLRDCAPLNQPRPPQSLQIR